MERRRSRADESMESLAIVVFVFGGRQEALMARNGLERKGLLRRPDLGRRPRRPYDGKEHPQGGDMGAIWESLIETLEVIIDMVGTAGETIIDGLFGGGKPKQ